MAKPIPCDAPGCTMQANYMLTDIQAGNTSGLCSPHFATYAAMFVQMAAGDEPNAEQAAAAVGADEQLEAAQASDADAEVFTCAGCGVEFPTIESIEQHVRDVHTAPPDGADDGTGATAHVLAEQAATPVLEPAEA